MPGSAAAVDSYQQPSPGFSSGFDRRQLADQLSNLFTERASFELNDEDVVALRRSLHLSSRDSLTALRKSLQSTRPDPGLQSEFAAWQERHPCALKNFASILQRARGKRLAVFLDYDGTLTPIVKNPDEAYMSEQMRDVVRQLAQLFPTAIISGRGREKLQNFVQLKEMFYAGSHGLDIVGPRDPNSPEEQFAFQPAARFESTMNSVYDSLTHRLRSIPGASVEHNKFCVSAHFRNCCPEAWEGILAAVQATVAEHPELKFSKGRKVLEIKPQVDWDKGKALAHLLDALGLDDCSNVLPIYLGDDQTDEDAFRVLRLRSDGLGILVSTKAKATAATYALQTPAAVSDFLSQLVAWGRTSDNHWQSCHGCNGWELDKSQAAASPAAPDDSPPSPDTPSSAASPARGNDPGGASCPDSRSDASRAQAADANGDAPGDASCPDARNDTSKHQAHQSGRLHHNGWQNSAGPPPGGGTKQNGQLSTAEQVQEAQKLLRQQLRLQGRRSTDPLRPSILEQQRRCSG